VRLDDAWLARLLAFLRLHELPGLFLFVLLEEAGVPLLIPGDTLVAAAGARPGQTPIGILTVIALASVAATLGSSILYVIVRRGGRPLLERYGRLVHLEPGRLRRLEGWFARYGPAAIVIGRLIPGLRTPTTIMAALAAVPYRTFGPSTALASVLWATLYVGLGAALGREGPVLLAAFHALLRPIAGLTAVALVVGLAGIVWRWRARRLTSSPTEAIARGRVDRRQPCDGPSSTATTTTKDLRHDACPRGDGAEDTRRDAEGLWSGCTAVVAVTEDGEART
jgi:membrane protein DedA with SNARE-associated domain